MATTPTTTPRRELHPGYGTVWSFKLPNTRVELRLDPCKGDPADDFEFKEHIDAVREGEEVLWFDADVVVLRNGRVIGQDSVCSCTYASADEFIAPGGFFHDMVCRALDDARATLASSSATG